MKYRKKPVEVDAIQWRAFEMLIHDIIWFFGGLSAVGAKSIRKHRGNLIIKTLEGEMTASDGDWIIKGVKGELYPCKPDIFAQTYEPVSPKAIVPTAQPSEAAADQKDSNLEPL